MLYTIECEFTFPVKTREGVSYLWDAFNSLARDVEAAFGKEAVTPQEVLSARSLSYRRWDAIYGVDSCKVITNGYGDVLVLVSMLQGYLKHHDPERAIEFTWSRKYSHDLNPGATEPFEWSKAQRSDIETYGCTVTKDKFTYYLELM